ncbi:hypothetical protein KP509_16G071300 [Ceratopteris richardii]|uniref:Uncharacterized protein n=1 Tax=Ceratopteris richardii TaxID=49495 RepID=A0A8T2T1Q4_CERRI|nr:hypothetical protein KP509_16G071300 [Ceratopteris richardii]
MAAPGFHVSRQPKCHGTTRKLRYSCDDNRLGICKAKECYFIKVASRWMRDADRVCSLLDLQHHVIDTPSNHHRQKVFRVGCHRRCFKSSSTESGPCRLIKQICSRCKFF